jgi:hypothetical protein
VAMVGTLQQPPGAPCLCCNTGELSSQILVHLTAESSKPVVPYQVQLLDTAVPTGPNSSPQMLTAVQATCTRLVQHSGHALFAGSWGLSHSIFL